MFNLSTNLQTQEKNKQQKEKWRLLHAKDFHSLMYPCFTFCRIIGIFPYRINASNFEVLKSRYVLLGFITWIFFIHGGIRLYNDYTTDVIVNANIWYLPSILANDCLLLFGCFIMIITVSLSGPRMRLIQSIQKISSKLPPEFYQQLSRLIHIKDIIGFLYIAGFMLIITFLNPITFLHTMYINLVIFQIDMLYVNCVCVLKACFKGVNNNLIHIQEFMANDKPHISKVIYHKQKNQFLIMELNALKKQHLTISDTVQNLNTIFSLHLLATMIITFTTLTFSLYYIIMIWRWKAFITIYLKISIFVFLFLHAIYIFIKLILIVWACETGKTEAFKISISIHDALNSITDEQIKDELQLFSLQISHCNNTFSAKGFSIDAKFLAGMVGSITTYLLILFQFFNISCNK